MNVNPITSFSPISTGNSAFANSASSVQQQADVLSLPPADQFLTQLQQVQSPQQFQAMISQMTGQPDRPVISGGTLPTAHHCQGGGAHRGSSSSQLTALNASRTQAAVL
jgi:hypothetical protein